MWPKLFAIATMKCINLLLPLAKENLLLMWPKFGANEASLIRRGLLY